MSNANHTTDSFPAGDAGVWEEGLERFEEAWQDGRRPALEDFLPSGSGRDATLRELVHVDLEYRLKTGEPARVEDYLGRFPELAGDRALVRALAADEYRLRRRREGLVSADEYRRRFPWLDTDVFPGARTAGPTASPTPVEADPETTLPFGPAPARPGVGAGAGTVRTGARYHVKHLHARGGLGEIQVAVDEELHREVALKLLQPGQAGHPDSRRRLLREVAITSQLEHPGIVPVYGLGQLPDGSPVYAMRFIRGESLQAALRRFHQAPAAHAGRERGLAFRQLLTQFVTVCNTVGYAHSRGVIHRDLKPDNIMLGAYGETLVVDWGLARPFGPGVMADAGAAADPDPARDGGQTQVGTVVGTPAYMSPEQAAGAADRLGPPADIYSLGATLYALLTGRPPVQDRLVSEVLDRVRRGSFARPREVNRHVPPALEAVCLKAMALRPEDRYGSALDLARDVERWLADEPVGAWREPWRVTARRWLGRHGTLVTAAAVAVVALAVLAAVTVWLLGAREQDQLAKQVAELRSAEDRRRLDQVDRDAYLFRILGADRAWLGNDFDRSVQWLEGCRPEFRRWEWHHLRRRSRGAEQTLGGYRDVVWAVAYRPDGRRLATAGLDGSVKIWDTATQKEWRVPRAKGRPVWGVAFSPDGRLLAAGGEDGVVRLWDAATGADRGVLDSEGWEITSLAFSPDRKLLAAGCQTPTAKGEPDGHSVVIVWDVTTRKEVRALAGHTLSVQGVAFSPDGRRLAASSADGTIKVWDVETGGIQASPPGHRAAVHTLAFSPDGRVLASAGDDQVVHVWDAATGRLVKTLQGHLHRVWGAAFSADGKLFASSSDDTTVKIWDARTWRLLYTLRGHRGGIANVAFSPDSRRLASASDDQTVKIWDVAARPELRTLSVGANRVWGVALSADGRLAATSGDDRIVRVWEVETGRVVHTFAAESASARVAFRPDGRQLASAHDDGGIRLWDLRAGALERTLTGHGKAVWGLAYRPDGKVLASASHDGTVRLWDPAGGKPLRSIRAHDGRALAVAFSPDGRRLASGGADKKAKVWDPETGRGVLTLAGHAGDVLGVAFRPDGKVLATCTADVPRTITREPGEIKIWDLAGGQARATLRAHSGAVTSVAFSPDGLRLAASGSDGTVRLWEPAAGQEILALYGHQGAVAQVVFSRDGRRLASAGLDGIAVLWKGGPVAGD